MLFGPGMCPCISVSPGIRNFPRLSTRNALAGTVVPAAGPTFVILPFCTITVWSDSTCAPSIGTTFTLTKATGRSCARAGSELSPSAASAEKAIPLTYLPPAREFGQPTDPLPRRFASSTARLDACGGRSKASSPFPSSGGPMRPHSSASVCLLMLVVQTSSLPAQGRFTVEDVFDVANVAIADLSQDGRWLASTGSTLRDRLGNDNRRYGDPSYLAPGAMDLLVIDTRSGQTQKVFADRRQVRSIRWSPDGNLLALLVRRGDGFEPAIWERRTGKLRPILLPRERVPADNPSLPGSRDGQQILL